MKVASGHFLRVGTECTAMLKKSIQPGFLISQFRMKKIMMKQENSNALLIVQEPVHFSYSLDRIIQK